MPEFLIDGPSQAECTVVLAHGAGAAMDSPFLATLAEGLADREIRVVRFEFPYMRRRRDSGRKSPPDRAPVLLDTWREVIRHWGAEVIIGGKSLGGRMASLVADEAGVAGLVCLGYPFHAPGKPLTNRGDHLKTLQTPALILQGERDPFGSRDEVAGYELAERIEVCWLADGDHSFKPRKSSGRTLDNNLREAVAATADFAARCRARP